MKLAYPMVLASLFSVSNRGKVAVFELSILFIVVLLSFATKPKLEREVAIPVRFAYRYISSIISSISCLSFMPRIIEIIIEFTLRYFSIAIRELSYIVAE